jgi:hypothetical protein
VAPAYVFHRKSIKQMKSEVCRVLSGLWPPSFTLKHTLEALFYDQTHATPPFFTMKHTEFTPKHMIRAANGIW